MDQVSVRPYSLAEPGLGLLICIILFVYALSYPPFITPYYISTSLRLGIEVFTLFLLIIVVVQYRYALAELVWFLMVVTVFGFTLLLGIDVFDRTISSFNKLIFFTLAISLFLGNRRIAYTCREIWIRLWFLLGAMAVLAFVGYVTHTIPFTPLDFAASVGEESGTSYYYLNNPFLGNLIPRGLFGLEFGRVVGFCAEGGNLGFFFGFNILVARDWITDAKRARAFIWVNLLGGVATLSLTWFFFMLAYFLRHFVFGKEKEVFQIHARLLLYAGSLLISGALILALPLLAASLLEQSSIFFRLDSYYEQLRILANNSWDTWLFGNGVGITVRRGLGGIDSGLLAILVERGIIMLALMVYLLARCTGRNRWLMAYLLYYNCFFDFFWDPIFVLLLTIYRTCSPTLGENTSRAGPFASNPFRVMAT